MLCIFCYPDPAVGQSSAEHVIPDALGGTLTFGDVCKACNDRLGSSVDTHLANNFLIQMILMGLGIRSKSGRIPSPLVDGTIMGTEMVGTYRPDSASRGEVRVRPSLEPGVSGAGNPTKTIIASAKDFDQIVKKVTERASRHGKEIAIHEKTLSTVSSPVVQKTISMNAFDLCRPLLKIAYEFAYLQLGTSYLSDALAHDLRQAIGGSGSAFLSYYLFPPQPRLFPEDLPSHVHGLRLRFSDNDIRCHIRIFNVLEAEVRVSYQPKRYEDTDATLICDPLAKSSQSYNSAHIQCEVHPSGRVDWTEISRTEILVNPIWEGEATAPTRVELPVRFVQCPGGA